MDKDLTKLLEELCIKSYLSVESVKCKRENDGEILKFEISTDEPQIVIGKHGETLFALQQVFRLMAAALAGDEEIPHIIVDVDGYRDNQVEGAYKMADAAIKRMEEKGMDRVELLPMPSYKRRAVHCYIVEKYPDINTESTGFGQDRKIVLSKK